MRLSKIGGKAFFKITKTVQIKKEIKKLTWSSDNLSAIRAPSPVMKHIDISLSSGGLKQDMPLTHSAKFPLLSAVHWVKYRVCALLQFSLVNVASGLCLVIDNKGYYNPYLSERNCAHLVTKEDGGQFVWFPPRLRPVKQVFANRSRVERQ